MEELIKPNWHVGMVHFPIAMLALGAFLELLSFLGWRRSAARQAGRWMILAGAFLSVPATFSGLYALSTEAPQGISAIAKTDPVLAQQLTYHVWTQSAVTVAAMLLVTVWIGMSDAWRDRFSLFFKVLLLATVVVTLYGSHVGGQQVYEHGLGVRPTTEPATLPTMQDLKSVDTWTTLFPPDQTHIVIAGFAMAAACVCLGLSARATHFEEMTPVETRLQIASAFARQETLPVEGDPYQPYVSPINHTPTIRTGRLWLLALVAILLASASGVAILWFGEQMTSFNDLWTSISKPINDGDPQFTRRLAHAAAGAIIVVDSLILLLLSCVARRRATILAMFALPLILAMAAQIWFGILLLEGPDGPITRFMH